MLAIVKYPVVVNYFKITFIDQIYIYIRYIKNIKFSWITPLRRKSNKKNVCAVVWSTRLK